MISTLSWNIVTVTGLLGAAMTETPVPTFTPLPTFPPLPTDMLVPPILSVATPTPPVAQPIGPGSIDSTTLVLVIVGIGLLLLILIIVAFARRAARRRRQLQATQPVPIVAPAIQTPLLEFTAASGKIISFQLNKPLLTLGRASDNDIVVPDSVPNADTVSNHHAQIRREQEELVVVDLGSRNGLMVAGWHTNQNVLQDGDRIGFGSAEAIFRVPTPDGPQGQRSAA